MTNLSSTTFCQYSTVPSSHHNLFLHCEFSRYEHVVIIIHRYGKPFLLSSSSEPQGESDVGLTYLSDSFFI